MRPATSGSPVSKVGAVLSVRDLLHCAVLGPRGEYLGYVFDVAAQPSSDGYPVVSGVLACVGVRESILDPTVLDTWRGGAVRLRHPTGPPLDPGDTLRVRYSVLGRRVAIGDGVTVRARDVRLSRTAAGWVLAAIDPRGPAERRTGAAETGLVDWLSLAATDRCPGPVPAPPRR